MNRRLSLEQAAGIRAVLGDVLHRLASERTNAPAVEPGRSVIASSAAGGDRRER